VGLSFCTRVDNGALSVSESESEFESFPEESEDTSNLFVERFW